MSELTSKDHGLSDQELRFCHLYAFSLDRSLAYRMAGYTNGRGGKSVEQLMALPRIREYIGTVARANPVEVTNAILALALTPITDIIAFDGREVKIKHTDFWSNGARLAVKKFQVKSIVSKDPETGLSEVIGHDCSIELFDRLQALKMLAEKCGLLKGNAVTDMIEEIEGEKPSTAVEDMFFRFTGVQLQQPKAKELADAGVD